MKTAHSGMTRDELLGMLITVMPAETAHQSIDALDAGTDLIEFTTDSGTLIRFWLGHASSRERESWQDLVNLGLASPVTGYTLTSQPPVSQDVPWPSPAQLEAKQDHLATAAALADYLNGEWPNCFNDGFQNAVAEAILETFSVRRDDGGSQGEDDPQAIRVQAQADASDAVITEAVRGITDQRALNAIAWILTDPEWGAGMLEDIAALVRGTGRPVEDIPGPDDPDEFLATWDRH